MTEDRWEHGSTFHLPWLEPTDRAPSTSLPTGVMTGSGRIALGLLLRQGHQVHGWKRLWIPSYYCSDVVESLGRLPLRIRRYPCGPLGSGPLPEAREGDVLLRVNYFGWGIPGSEHGFDGSVIEDHTHAPSAGAGSEADYCFASLRKTLPLPDGGVAWSPRSLPLPPLIPSHPVHQQAVELRLAAMAMKAAYLSGASDDKKSFRELDQKAEEQIALGHPSSLSGYSGAMLPRLPIEAWADIRTQNHHRLRSELLGATLVTILGPDGPTSPSMAILQMPTPTFRNALRAALIRERIYTAVLWPVAPETEALRPEDLEFSMTTLSVHVDSRYTTDDMTRVAGTIRTMAQSIQKEVE